MLNNGIKTILVILFFLYSTCAYPQEEPCEIRLKPLAIKEVKKSYKIFYGEEAEQELMKALIKDDGLKKLLGMYEPIDSAGNEVFIRENEAFEYCPELGYVIESGGHGFVSVYDLNNKKEICSNPSTYVYSPSKKYRFGGLMDDGMKYFIEEKVGDEYICYRINLSDKLWDDIQAASYVDDETFRCLLERLKTTEDNLWAYNIPASI